MTIKQVTLSTLCSSTTEEVVAWIVHNLIVQNQQSLDEDGQCKYRGPDGLKCAAGWLLTDDEYIQLDYHNEGCLEGTDWEGATEYDPTYSHLIRSLQLFHDDAFLPNLTADELHSYLSNYLKKVCVVPNLMDIITNAIAVRDGTSQ